MKVTVRVLASVLVLALVMVSPVWAQPGKPGELTVALSSFASDVMDPVLGGHIVKFYLGLIFDYLVGVTPDGQLSKDGGIARAWEASADHKRWTFHLRKGVKFHNGDELTAEDVKFSITRAIGKRSTTGYAGPLRALIQDIETPAPDRVVIVTKEPTLIIPPYLSRVLSSEGMIVPRKYIEAKGDDVFARAAVGSGPYRVVEAVSGSHVKLEAVDNHWRVGTPKYKTVMFKRIPEEATRIALLRRGEADIVEISRDRVKEIEKAGFPVHFRKHDALIDFWWIPPLDKSPLKDKRVREALNLAIDRAEIAQTIFGGYAEPGAVPWGLSWSFPGIGFKITPEMHYANDPARARKLLADAGFASGFPLELYAYQLPGLSEGKAMAEALGGYWQKIGVQTKLIPVDYPAFRKAWIDNANPGALGYYNLANRDWVGTYALIEKYAGKSKTATIKDPEITGIIDAVMKQTDQQRVNALMRNLFARLKSEHLGFPLVYVNTPYASSKRVAKWSPGSVMYELNIEEIITSK
jgi:peptide/nickel transport system substrate-binding protein